MYIVKKLSFITFIG